MFALFWKTGEDRSLTINNEVPDKDLVYKIKNKDINSFEEIYNKYIGKIYALSLRMSGDPIVAEELCQDIFIRAWEKIETFKGLSSFYTWLYRLAVNHILGHHRIRSRKKEYEMQVENIYNLSLADERKNVDIETSIELEKAIALLPAKARQVLVLFDIEDYSHEEISDIMNISIGTSKAQLHRARKLLRRVLES